MSQWAHYSEVDPEWAQLLPTLTFSPMADILKRRAQVAQLLAQRLQTMDYPRSGLTVSEKSIPVTGGEILIRMYVPESDDPAQTYPILVDLHGGGYCFGNLDNDDVKCRNACVDHRISVVNVDYRLAPEYPWPTGQNDSYDAIKWVVDHSEELKGDIARGFIITGSSAGAGFTCIITQRARDDPDLKGKITGQLLQIPPTYYKAGGRFPAQYASQLLSSEQNKDDPILSPTNSRIFMDAYKPGSQDDPSVSPLMAESFANLPPAYVQVAGGDPLRDEGLLYTQLLGESGVPTKLDVYRGVPHGFSGYAPQLKISAKWRKDFDEGLKWLLSLPKARSN